MNKILNALKSKFNSIKQNVVVRTVLISGFALLLIFSITLAWYINNLGLWGVEFETGNIEFNAYVYDESGKLLAGPISSADEDVSKYLNAPLASIENAQVGSIGTAYIVVESTGSIGIQYKIALDITGQSENANAYLGGYKYNISKVSEHVPFTGASLLDVSRCPRPERINDEIVTIDRNPVNGTIADKNGYDVYRFDYTLVQKNEEYTGNAINIYYNVFATQIGGDFEDDSERGYTYYCSTKEDIDRVKIEAYAGDIIKLSSDIVYYGDLVFNKPVHLETNDFTLTVNGNLMYDYVLANDLRIDAGGLGRVVVQCTKDGVGGNFIIKAPQSNVTLTGSNAPNGDILVEKKFSVDATNAYGASGVSFNTLRIVDSNNVRKTILLESNTRATVSFGTTVGSIQSVVKANNIAIVNNGVIGEINLSNMNLLEQTNSPQIYILNNNDILSPIFLPNWSQKFYENAQGKCFGNTRIIQSLSGSPMPVTGSNSFKDADIEIEKKNVLVEQIEENNDSRLKIYYQDVDGKTTTIRSILEDYFTNKATTDCTISEVLQLEIISIGDKAITSADIAYMNSNSMLSLRHLDMERAHVYDRATNTSHRLPDSAFSGVKKYEKLVLPQSLVAIGNNALSGTQVTNIITIPSEVATFGTNWFRDGNYVYFASSVPVAQAAAGLTGVDAVFVDEPYIQSYKSVYSAYATRIYPMSVLDEAKEHFVRNTKSDEWEITYHIRGEDAVIGQNITIDGTVLKITSVYDNAYRHNFTSAKVDFADTVENLGSGNFYNNKNITYADLNNIRTLGDDVFTNCSNLSQVVFGYFHETIGANAFSGCVSLNQEVVLPSTMQTIGVQAFQQTPITHIHTGGTKTIGSRAFIGCKSLICAELPNVEEVAADGVNELFADCSALVSVGMQSLSKVSGTKMFMGCTSLREFYMATENDGVSLGTNTFAQANTSRLKLFVPEEQLAFYQSKRPAGIAASMIYPVGEKMGEELVNGFNIGTYIVSDREDNTYTLITSNIDYTDSLVIPAEHNGKAITEIYANAFRNQGITNVKLTIGNNVDTIGSNAFYGCRGLVEIDFGSSLETIGEGAFSYCSNLVQDVVLPDSMKKIEASAFRNSGIHSINTGGATSIGSYAFNACASLVYAELPEVTVVAEDGFNEVFTSCISLVSVDMPKLAKVYGSKMFMGCTSLAEIYMGTRETGITLGPNAFYNVDTAKIKLFVPESLVSFYAGRNILKAWQVYPRGIKIGDTAINGFVVGDYVLLDNDEGYTLVTTNLHPYGTVVVPETYNNKPITEVYANAFRNQTFTDADLRLGDQVKVIGDMAFYGATGLNSVVMDQVTTVGVEAFYGSSIKVLNGPKLTTISSNAFRKCSNLELINIPKIERIDSSYTFAECAKLKALYFEKVMYLDTYTFFGCKKIEKITINRAINSNGDNMPEVMTIEAAAPCKIYVPHRSLGYYPNPWSGKPVVSFDATATYNGDTYILSEGQDGRYTLIDFMPSRSMTSLSLPATVSADQIGNISIYAINYGAFSTIAGTLKSITLSSSIAQLANNALSECSALETISVAANNMYFTSVSGILYSKDAKMLVKYPVGRSGACDLTGSGYASTVAIGAGAFSNASKMTQIKFPASLLVIDSTAFENCTKLHTVQFTGTTPPTLMGTGIFDTKVEAFKMVIPTASQDVVTAYLCAYNFGEYEPYIDLNGHAAPSANTARNQVPLMDQSALSNTMAVLIPEKNSVADQLSDAPEEEPTGGEGPDPAQETEGAEA